MNNEFFKPGRKLIMYRNKIHTAPGILLVIFFHFSALSQHATINIDLKKELGDMKPIWAWFGYDEPNYTYMKDGKKTIIGDRCIEPGTCFCTDT
jgi:hypothetical protein